MVVTTPIYRPGWLENAQPHGPWWWQRCDAEGVSRDLRCEGSLYGMLTDLDIPNFMQFGNMPLPDVNSYIEMLKHVGVRFSRHLEKMLRPLHLGYVVKQLK